MGLWHWLIGTMLAMAGQAAAEPLTTGEWLVDLERDYRLSSPTSGSDIDEELCLLFVQAAGRLQTAPPEAWRSQARLLELLGQPAAACQALDRYLPLAQDDVRARLWQLGLSSELLQTAEERRAYYVEQLKKPGLPAPVSGELHRLLAEYHWNRNEKGPAAEQAHAAIKDDPHNLPARQLLAVLQGKGDTPQARIGLQLAQLELNPGRLDWILTLADDLMAIGLPDEAIPWYRHAMAVIEAREGGDVPAPLLMSLAWALVEQGAETLLETTGKQPATMPGQKPVPLAPPPQFVEAWQLTEKSLNKNRVQLAPYQARIMMAALRGDDQQELDQTRIARGIWFLLITHDDMGQPEEEYTTQEDGRPVVKKWSPDILASFAWFLAHYGAKAGTFKLRGKLTDKETGDQYTGTWDLKPLSQAERVAEMARGRDPDSLLAKRVLGSVRRQENDHAEAENRLRGIADQDVWARIELAQLLYDVAMRLADARKREEAIAQLVAAGQEATSPELRLTIRRIWASWEFRDPASHTQTKPVESEWLRPASPAVADEIRAVTGLFPKEVLPFPLQANKHLALNIRLLANGLRIGEPWRCAFEIRNIGSLPITIGPGLMLEPAVLCIVTLRGDRERTETLSIPLDQRLQLTAGQSLSIVRTLDIGRIRAGLIGTPQVAYDVEIEAMLNPIEEPSIVAGAPPIWKPGPAGIRARPLKLRREPFRVFPDSIRNLLTETKAPVASARTAAMETLASLLAEHQHLASGRLRYAAQPIDPATVRTVILARAEDTDWEVRARLAECLRWFVLDSAATQQSVKLLNDPHWLVRGLAMRAMAEQQGTRFQGVLQVVAQQDPDEWVRRMSRTLLARMAAARPSPPAQTISPPPAAKPATGP
ncbi:MAG TPA: HEAT repeat domain-containing protein [Phycisphaerae bacterium]|nr:HEAT repeat domain-containing protein [Phycisphaerae bacterium]HRY68847.1 HEAT repeat domain-containing protein [Phycisphaerae bacterium]HSA27512.1 HEAT repeat domain-containing protein [Phycisphaerae bacterium]